MTLRGQKVPVRKRGLRVSIAFLIIIGLVAGGMFFAGSIYQSNVDNTQGPSVNNNTGNPNLHVTTGIFSTYLNISMVLSGTALTSARGTLRVQLGSGNQWSDFRDYAIAPGGWQSYLFYPTIPISSVDSIMVST